MADNKTTTYSHVRAFLSSRQTTSSMAGRAMDLLPNQGHVSLRSPAAQQVTGPENSRLAAKANTLRVLSRAMGLCHKY